MSITSYMLLTLGDKGRNIVVCKTPDHCVEDTLVIFNAILTFYVLIIY